MNKLQIYTDGGARGNPGPAGIGIYVLDQDLKPIFSASDYIGTATNNEAEYKAFLVSLAWLKDYSQTHQIDVVESFLDSKLVVEQINKNWKVKEPRMQKFAKQAWEIIAGFNFDYQIYHVRREKNKEADALVNQALDAI